MAAISYLFDRILNFLERMVFRGRDIFKKDNTTSCKNKSYREYSDWLYFGKTDY